jgi:hypothetical protein
MRLSNGYIKRRPLMERDGSGVSALLGLDGFVVVYRIRSLQRTHGGARSRRFDVGDLPAQGWDVPNAPDNRTLRSAPGDGS